MESEMAFVIGFVINGAQPIWMGACCRQQPKANCILEELLVLGGRIGNVSTSLSEEIITTQMNPKPYLLPATTINLKEVASEEQETNSCIICLDDYKIRENIGILQGGHEYQKFAKDSGNYIEEKKLKVILISPSSSPVLLTVNGDMKQDISNEIHVQKDRVPSGVENIPPPFRVSEEVKGLEVVHDMEEDRTDEDIVTRHAENAGDMKPAKDAVQLNLTKDSEELKSRLSMMDSKLREGSL